MKVYATETPLNSACIAPLRPYVSFPSPLIMERKADVWEPGDPRRRTRCDERHHDQCALGQVRVSVLAQAVRGGGRSGERSFVRTSSFAGREKSSHPTRVTVDRSIRLRYTRRDEHTRLAQKTDLCAYIGCAFPFGSSETPCSPWSQISSTTLISGADRLGISSRRSKCRRVICGIWRDVSHGPANYFSD